MSACTAPLEPGRHGVPPLQFPGGQSADTLGLTGEETFHITGVSALNDSVPHTAHVRAGDVEFDAVGRIDTPGEADYYRHGGIMPYVLRTVLEKPWGVASLPLIAFPTPGAVRYISPTMLVQNSLCRT